MSDDQPGQPDQPGIANFAEVSEKEFAQLISQSPPELMKEVMTSDYRKPVLDEIFRRMATQIRPDRAKKTKAVIHWKIMGRADGGHDHYEVVIDHGTCTTTAEPQRDATLTITVGVTEFLKLVTNNANPVMAFMTGKLKAKGDLGLAANMTSLFSIPKA